MPDRISIAVEEITLRINRGKVSVFAIIGGVERALWWKAPAAKNFEEKVGPIAIHFSPRVTQKR
jgi:hypothetical protein